MKKTENKKKINHTNKYRAKFKFKSIRFGRLVDGWNKGVKALRGGGAPVEEDVMFLQLLVLVERFPNPITTSF